MGVRNLIILLLIKIICNWQQPNLGFIKSRWICINPREDSLSFFIAELPQVAKRLSTLNDILAVAVDADMFNKTHNIVFIEGYITRVENSVLHKNMAGLNRLMGSRTLPSW
jgi:hypothetical protein